MIRYITLLFLCIITSIDASTESVAPIFNDINHSIINYTKKDGLSQVTILAIAEDQLGFIWFGTQGGLNRYDGTEFISFDAEPLKKDKLAGNFITALCDDGRNTMWVGTSSGLSAYNYKTGVFRSFFTEFNQNIPSNAITSLQCSKDKIWVSVEGGAFYSMSFSDNKVIQIPHSYNMQIIDIVVIKSDVYLATDKGVFIYNSVNKKLRQFTDSPAQSIATNAKTLFVGRHDGWLDAFSLTSKNKTLIFHQKISSVLDNSVNGIVYSNNQLWLATNNGIYIVSNSGVVTKSYTHSPLNNKSLSNNIVISLHIDRKKGIWIGTDAGGINYLNPTTKNLGHINKHSYPLAPLKHHDIRGFALDSENRLWFATTNGIYIFHDNKFHLAEFFHPNLAFLAKASVTNLLFNNNALWITTQDHGVVLFNLLTNKVTNFSPKYNNSPSIKFYSVVEYKQEMVFSTYGYGLLKYDKEQNNLQPFFSSSTNSPSHVVEMKVINDELWFGSIGQGLFRTYENEIQQLKITDGLLSGLTFAIAQDNKGRIWVGSDAGINIINDDFNVINTISKQDGLADNSIWTMVNDNQGSMWVGSSEGLSRVNTETYKIRNFNDSEGIQGYEYNFGASWLSPKGQVFIGGTNGFNHFMPEEVSPSLEIPLLYLTNISLLGQPIYEGDNAETISVRPEYIKTLKLKHDQDIVSFTFSSLAYANQRLTYFYRMSGLSQQWLEMDKKSHQVHLFKFPSGEYQLEVFTLNDQGNKSPIYKLAITLSAPWWWNSWSITAYILLLVIVLYSFIALRLRNLRIQKIKLQKQVIERTKTITILSEIGKEITASLDLNQILETVYRHVNELMDATIFGIGLYQPENKAIEYRLAIENDHYYKPYKRDTTDQNQFPVWCINNSKTIFINDVEQEYSLYIDKISIPTEEGELSDGSFCQRPHSMMYIPLIINNKTLGLITVQSYQKNSYKPHHMDMLQTIASYTATALDNANSYLELEEKNIEILSTQQSLIQSEKMISLGTLTAGVAHEINNPTNFTHASVFMMKAEIKAIKLFLKELAGGENADSKVLQSFEDKFAKLIELTNTAYEGTQRIKTIVKELQSFSRVDDVVHYEENLSPLLTSTIHLVKTQYGDINIKADFQDDPLIKCQPARLSQVFMNIIINACQAINQIKQKNQNFEGNLAIRLFQENNQLIITFKDNGTGMEKTTLTKIFDPFFTTKEVGSGTGLGMAISFGIIKEHNGLLTAESILNEGSTLTICLPNE